MKCGSGLLTNMYIRVAPVPMQSWWAQTPDCPDLEMKIPDCLASDGGSVHSGKGLQAMFTQHLPHAPCHFRSFPILSFLIRIITLWGSLAPWLRRLKRRSCVTNSELHRWKRAEVGVEHKRNGLQSPYSFYYMLPATCCFRNTAWYVTDNHKT